MRLTELQDNFNKKFAHLTAISSWRHWVMLGLKQTSSFVIQFKDSVDRPELHQFFGHLEGLLQPHLLSLGIRLSRVSDHSVEVIVPDWWRTRNNQGTLDEGTLISAAVFALSTLLKQTTLFSQIVPKFEQIQLTSHRPLKGTMRARLRWTKLQQEAAWARLQNAGKNHEKNTNSESQESNIVNMQIDFFDSNELKSATITIDVLLTLGDAIAYDSRPKKRSGEKS